jgi:hypothetical protein
MRPMVTEAEILAKKTARGGWTRATLAAWGVPWPPPKGWKAVLTGDAPTTEWIALAKAMRALKDIEAATDCPKARDLAREAIWDIGPVTL